MSENKQCMAVQICPVGISYDPNNQFGIVKIAPASPDATPEPNCNIIQICNTHGVQSSTDALSFRLFPNDMNNQNSPSQNPMNTIFDNNAPNNMNNQNPPLMNTQSSLYNQIPIDVNTQPSLYNQIPNDGNIQPSLYNQIPNDMNTQSSLYNNQIPTNTIN